jgi:hypothetical protein
LYAPKASSGLAAATLPILHVRRHRTSVQTFGTNPELAAISSLAGHSGFPARIVGVFIGGLRMTRPRAHASPSPSWRWAAIADPRYAAFGDVLLVALAWLAEKLAALPNEVHVTGPVGRAAPARTLGDHAPVRGGRHRAWRSPALLLDALTAPNP